jgi:5S rRNA maturation endonuclease (ribonuclease M5)
MSSTLLSHFNRVRRGRHCPVCDHADWCLVERNGDEISRVLCQRIASRKRWGQAGWLHVLRSDRRHSPPRGPRPITLEPKQTYGELVVKLERGLEPDRLHHFAASLGVSVESLRRLRIGFAHGGSMQQLGLKPSRGAFTFPMVDHHGRAIGVRIRLESGKKLCQKGSALGLFVPLNLDATGTVYIAEGESDTAALLTLGVEAIGRPSATACDVFVAKLAREHAMKDVVVVADRDEVGQMGAVQLARNLAALVPLVRLVTPPMKDAREWLRAGATAGDVAALVAAASPFGHRIGQRGGTV